jgi:hypothetical protein
MRRDLQDFLNTDSGRIGAIGWESYLGRFMDLCPTDEDRHDLGELLLSSEDEDTVARAAGAMMMCRHTIFRPYLFQALERTNVHAKRCCMEALIRWRDAEAISLLCKRPDIQEAVGDRLPERVEPLAAAGHLTPEQEEALLRLAAARLRRTEVLDSHTEPWVDLLVKLKSTSREVAFEILRVWGNERPQEYMYKYTILLAMVSKPWPDYEPAFRKAAKSKVEDLREMGELGLAALKRMENGKTPFPRQGGAG